MDNLHCTCCGFTDSETEKFVGIFTHGLLLMNTNKEECALYACPHCGVTRMVTDKEYIAKRKSEWKLK